MRAHACLLPRRGRLIRYGTDGLEFWGDLFMGTTIRNDNRFCLFDFILDDDEDI